MTDPILQPTAATPPGWYLNPEGKSQWWNGQGWGVPAKKPAKAPLWAMFVLAAVTFAIGLIVGAAGTTAANQAELNQAYEQIRDLERQTSNTDVATPATEETATPIAEPAAPTLTAGQTNAARKAKSYLSVSAFSRTGLIGQLEFEGFSTEDATYGVDSLEVDWSAQAAAKAADYLSVSAFSHSGLVDQLIFEGFSAEQAEFGVSSAGL